eukprot:TRINITY_DN16499_c0_g1_i2.p1 TRINITY_DN16499_c0_g1~~TRINITY_DN16499_c0_g1_i2.p1  ORF type:complete len:122 (+),score=12.82 TRINITY_DN16499_c0_g1_i2:944-1309(+)
MLSWIDPSCTPLHYASVLQEREVALILASGASLHTLAQPLGLSPLEVANLLEYKSHPCSMLVKAAAGDWSVATHRLFPPSAREWAVELACVLHQLRQYHMVWSALPWVQIVLPHCVRRDPE